MATSVEKMNGIGPKTAGFLKKHGITTVEALVKSGPDTLAQAAGFNQVRAEQFVAEAVKMLGAVRSQPVANAAGKASSRSKPEKPEKKKRKKDKRQDKKANKKKRRKDKKKDKKKNKKNKK